MTAMRKGESEQHSRFRKSRLFHSMDEWYFITRESTVEGPYEHKGQAEQELKAYIVEMNTAAC